MRRALIKTCPNCGAVWQIADYEIRLKPYPHYQCEDCGHMIPVW